MKSRVVVLGGCGAWPEPGRACSGFLLEHDGFHLAIDLGYGTLSRLLALLGSTTAPRWPSSGATPSSSESTPPTGTSTPATRPATNRR
jgi:hypothetical protein